MNISAQLNIQQALLFYHWWPTDIVWKQYGFPISTVIQGMSFSKYWWEERVGGKIEEIRERRKDKRKGEKSILLKEKVTDSWIDRTTRKSKETDEKIYLSDMTAYWLVDWFMNLTNVVVNFLCTWMLCTEMYNTSQVSFIEIALCKWYVCQNINFSN